MKKQFLYIIFTAFALVFVSSGAQTQNITTPRIPSPQAKVTQTIGISTVTVDYSRPSVRGRQVWGALVPYGWNVQAFGNQKSAPWRSGANENSVIIFSHNAKVEGQDVPAGKYGLFFTINEDNTGEVVLSKDYRSWGSFFYEADRDQLRAPIRIRDHAMTEMLSFDFINVDKNTAELVLNWEKKQFPVKIEFAVDEIVIANAAEELKGPIGFGWQGFASAANYSMNNKVQPELGLVWAERAVGMNKNFNTLMAKAGLLEQLGKTSDVMKLRAEAVGMATEAELNTYGYQLLGQNKFDEAIHMFTLNTERHPESANTWDSLGEGYALKGDKENAIKNFKKCLSMNPNDGIRANSEKYLKQLGEM